MHAHMQKGYMLYFKPREEVPSPSINERRIKNYNLAIIAIKHNDGVLSTSQPLDKLVKKKVKENQ